MPAPRRRWLTGLLFAVLLAAPPALARERAGNDGGRARTHFKAAEAHFSLGEFGPALEEYRKAYLLRPLPPLLFNMAQCHRHLGDLEKAAFLLRRFLTMSPTLTQRSQAEAVLQDVELARKGKPAPRPTAAPTLAPATRPVQAASAPSALPRAAARPSTRAAAAPAALGELVTTPATSTSRTVSTRKQPLYKRWWLWTIVAGAAVATATAIGVVASRGDDLPRGTLQSVDYR